VLGRLGTTMKDLARGIELICVLLSALLATGLLPGASPATCAAPFLFGVAVRVGYPPAGKGVGQPAPSLAEGLEVVSVSELGAADRGGEGDGDGSAGSRSPVEPWHLLPKASLAAGKVHVLCFCGASLGPQIVTALRRVQAAYVSSRALPVSFLLISRASADEVAAYASGALAGAGAGAPIARDATGATSDSYLSSLCGRRLLGTFSEPSLNFPKVPHRLLRAVAPAGPSRVCRGRRRCHRVARPLEPPPIHAGPQRGAAACGRAWRRGRRRRGGGGRLRREEEGGMSPPHPCLQIGDGMALCWVVRRFVDG